MTPEIITLNCQCKTNVIKQEFGLLRGKKINLPNICIFLMDVCFLPPDGTTLTDVCTENREVGFHLPLLLSWNPVSDFDREGSSLVDKY